MRGERRFEEKAMGKNLNGKIGFIIAILVIFVYGIFYGLQLPHMGPWQSMKNGNINLGLDLRGGSHLVLKVKVEEAINSTTDRDMQRLNTELTADGATAGKPDPAHPETIAVSGFQPAQQSAVRDVL